MKVESGLLNQIKKLILYDSHSINGYLTKHSKATF